MLTTSDEAKVPVDGDVKKEDATMEGAAGKARDKAFIKFKDCIGRKYSFPFHIVKTWQVILPRSGQLRYQF